MKFTEHTVLRWSHKVKMQLMPLLYFSSTRPPCLSPLFHVLSLLTLQTPFKTSNRGYCSVRSQHSANISHRKGWYWPSGWAPGWLSWAVKHVTLTRAHHTQTHALTLLPSHCASVTFAGFFFFFISAHLIWTQNTGAAWIYEMRSVMDRHWLLPFNFLTFFFYSIPITFSLFLTSQGTTGRTEDVSGKWDVGTVPGQV